MDTLRALARPSARRRRYRWLEAGREATLEHRGRPDGPVRDPAVRELSLFHPQLSLSDAEVSLSDARLSPTL